MKSTLFRWGNYDVATGTSRFLASEVPSGLKDRQPRAAESDASPFVLLDVQAFLVGLDAVAAYWSGRHRRTGQTGHAYKIPSRLCYENTSKTNGILNFNASSCYAAATGGTAPGAPANLQIIR